MENQITTAQLLHTYGTVHSNVNVIGTTATRTCVSVLCPYGVLWGVGDLRQLLKKDDGCLDDE